MFSSPYFHIWQRLSHRESRVRRKGKPSRDIADVSGQDLGRDQLTLATCSHPTKPGGQVVCVRRTSCEDSAEALLKSGDNYADFEAIYRGIELGEAATKPRRQETETENRVCFFPSVTRLACV